MKEIEEKPGKPDAFEELKDMLEKDKAKVEALKTIPDWIIKYDQQNYQSSAGRAIRELITTVKDLRSENDKLSQVCYDYEDNIECWKEEGRFRGWPESDLQTLEELQSAARKLLTPKD